MILVYFNFLVCLEILYQLMYMNEYTRLFGRFDFQIYMLFKWACTQMKKKKKNFGLQPFVIKTIKAISSICLFDQYEIMVHD